MFRAWATDSMRHATTFSLASLSAQLPATSEFIAATVTSMSATQQRSTHTRSELLHVRTCWPSALRNAVRVVKRHSWCAKSWSRREQLHGAGRQRVRAAPGSRGATGRERAASSGPQRAGQPAEPQHGPATSQAGTRLS